MKKTLRNMLVIGASTLGACSDEALDNTNVSVPDYICKIGDFQTEKTGNNIRNPVEKSFTQADITHIQGHYPNEIQDGVISIFYHTNSWMLMSNDKDDLRAFGRTLDSGSSLIIEGRADYRGSETWNDELGRQRAQGIADFLQTYTHGSVDFVSYGEKKASQDTSDREQLQRDRVVRVVQNRGLVSRALEVSPADVYLIDQSGSMQGEKWSQVQVFSFPMDAEVYTFESPRQDCSTLLSQRYPLGGTPLYMSLSDVLFTMKDSQTLTVLTDGDDTDGGKTPDQIVALARTKKISINVIGLGVSYPAALEQIASGTGGQAYIGQ